MKVGGFLKEMGLRDADGKPTPETLQDGLAVATPTRQGYDHYMWNREAIGRLLKEKGHKQKSNPHDPAHRVANEAHKLIKEGNRLESKEGGSMATFAYEAAIDEVHDALRKAKDSKRLGLAVRIYQQLKKLIGDEADKIFLMPESPVPLASVREHLLDVRLPQGATHATKPRL